MKASSALLKHIESEVKRKEASSKTKNLLTAGDDSSGNESLKQVEPIWLVLTTKKHVVDKKRLKPGKIPLPHSLYKSPASTICLITADPQRAFKDTIRHPLFPVDLSSRITKIIGISKLKGRYKSFESRRQLLNEHDIFLADDRVVTLLPRLLGKIFFESAKRPFPISLSPSKPKDAAGKSVKPVKSMKATESRAVVTPLEAAKEIGKALSSAQVYLSPATTTSIRVALSDFKAEQMADNIEAVVQGMQEKYITKGWRNIRAIHIKGPNTMALPIWLAKELWVEEEDIMEDEEVKEMAQLLSQKSRKRKGREGDSQANAQRKKPKILGDSDMSKEMAERREKLRQQKREAREEADGKTVAQVADTPKVGTGEKVKIKSKKPRAMAASA